MQGLVKTKSSYGINQCLQSREIYSKGRSARRSMHPEDMFIQAPPAFGNQKLCPEKQPRFRTCPPRRNIPQRPHCHFSRHRLTAALRKLTRPAQPQTINLQYTVLRRPPPISPRPHPLPCFQVPLRSASASLSLLQCSLWFRHASGSGLHRSRPA